MLEHLWRFIPYVPEYKLESSIVLIIWDLYFHLREYHIQIAKLENWGMMQDDDDDPSHDIDW